MVGDHGVLRFFYDNTHEIAPGRLWRTYQPSPGKLKKWRDKGVRTVVNLRGETDSGHFALEKEACETLGLTLVSFRVYSREAPSANMLRDARQLFKDIDYPAVMHCKSGADRTGVMGTLYRFFEEGAPLDEAMEQLSFRYGHVKQGKTGVIDYAFERYLAYADAHDKDKSSTSDFFEWVDCEYDPAAIKAEFLGSWWGNLLTEKLLRRE
ncbi:MAG: tyrosine-protein phosphatase [Pseudomonadota bacterium]